MNQSLRGVITFNYDTSLEQLYQGRFYYPLLEDQNAEGRLPLFKLHGSLNWRTDSRSGNIVALGPEQVAEMDHGDGWYCQPEVVGPTFFKQEITFDIQQDFRTRHYRRLWSNTWDLLRHARQLIFVGFSFPQTDFHAQALFRTAHLSDTGFQRVILCHRCDPNLVKTARSVFDGLSTPELTEFQDGLGDMVVRLDEVVALISN